MGKIADNNRVKNKTDGNIIKKDPKEEKLTKVEK
jgi:hypothetical protein